jgi:hypothetical protein
LLEAEGREEVLAHDAVLELGRLAQQKDELIAMLDTKRVLRRPDAAQHFSGHRGRAVEISLVVRHARRI